MLIIGLDDGTQVRVPGVRGIRRDGSKILCLDAGGETLSVLEAHEVEAFAIAPDPKPKRRKAGDRPGARAVSA